MKTNVKFRLLAYAIIIFANIADSYAQNEETHSLYFYNNGNIVFMENMNDIDNIVLSDDKKQMTFLNKEGQTLFESSTAGISMNAETYQDIFSDKSKSEAWLEHTFSLLEGANREIAHVGNGTNKSSWNPFCFDDCIYYGHHDNAINSSAPAWASWSSFHTGNYDSETGQDCWKNSYKGIYQATTFINNISKCKAMSDMEILDNIGQARFVRAYFYWLLLRKYGPVPLLSNEDMAKKDGCIAVPRNTYEEVACYIASEMVKAAQEIQYEKRDAANIGRPTKGACLATRALAYIYAASPLANGQLGNGYHNTNITDDIAKNLKDKNGNSLLSMNYDESKWARAAAACKDVIETGIYELYHAPFNTSDTMEEPATIVPPADGNFSDKNWPNGWKDIDPQKSYAKVFNGDIYPQDNPELIFSRNNKMLNDINQSIEYIVLYSMPVTCGGYNSIGLTQKMIDAYYMNDGTDVPGKDSELNGSDGSDRIKGWTKRQNYKDYPPLKVNVSMQYANREPRFYASVAFSGSVWENASDPIASNRNRQIFYYCGGGDGYYTDGSDYPRTGIGMRKWYNTKDYISEQYSTNNICAKTETTIRYADILLMYAEALNEIEGSYNIKSWDGSKTYNISRDLNEIKKGIQPIRIRAGVPDYSESTYTEKDKLREKIKRERMIELMAEGKRYFDLRRWMDAPNEETQKIYGLDIMKTRNEQDAFMLVTPSSTLTSTFSDKMYFWPIPSSEFYINTELTQNPGW